MTTPRDRIDVERRRAEQLPMGMHSRDEAVNYFAWQAEWFRDIAHGRIIDHGAGTGGLTNALLAQGARDIVALEPDADLDAHMRTRFAGKPVEVMHGTMDTYLEKHGPGTVDCIVSSNVIEHIENDVDCLRSMWDALRPGGAIGLYVPARPELFGSLDRAVGHYRRYTRSGLDRSMRDAGFTVKFVRYCNLISVLPWLVAGRVLKKERLGGGAIGMFDSVVFPVASKIEGLLRTPYGTNLAAIGVKS